MITWELAMDRYKISRLYLEMLAIAHPSLCNAETMMVKDCWK